MEPGRQLCVSGTGVHMKPRGWLPKPVKKLGNESEQRFKFKQQ